MGTSILFFYIYKTFNLSNMIDIVQYLDIQLLHTICFVIVSLLGLHVFGLYFGSSTAIDNTLATVQENEVDTTSAAISLEGVPARMDVWIRLILRMMV